MEIKRYNELNDYHNLITLFKSEKDWNWFLDEKNISKHKKSLKDSISYVAYLDKELVGYSRSIEDIESYIYVCELLVNIQFRGKNIGKKLLDRIFIDFPNHEILVMSDVDQYYKKLGYKIEGSIFKVSKS